MPRNMLWKYWKRPVRETQLRRFRCACQPARCRIWQRSMLTGHLVAVVQTLYRQRRAQPHPEARDCDLDAPDHEEREAQHDDGARREHVVLDLSPPAGRSLR
jgi:hypothetical protein